MLSAVQYATSLLGYILLATFRWLLERGRLHYQALDSPPSRLVSSVILLLGSLTFSSSISAPSLFPSILRQSSSLLLIRGDHGDPPTG